MTHRRRILEGIDACRPGSDDVHDPDLAFLAGELAQDAQARSLYDRAQHVDAAIAAAFSDVPAPEGLEARILARLSAARADSLPSNDPQPASLATSAASGAPIARRFSRRWFAVASAGMAVAATVAVVVLNLPAGPEVNKDNVDDLVREFFKADQQLDADPLVDPAPAGYSLSSAISVRGNVRWRSISGLLGRRGVAYDLPLPGAGRRARATLYVLPIPSTLTGLGGAPPRIPSTTEGVAIGAWQENGHLYVLAVSGGEKEYGLFMRAASIA